MASTLRRRLPSDTPAEPIPADDDDSVQPKEPIKAFKPRTRKRRNMVIFLLGSLAGLMFAGFYRQVPDLGDLSMDSLFDVLPAGLVKDVRDLIKGERDFSNNYEAFSVGLKARSEGLSVNHPIIMIRK
jgi:phospholipid:diacylglycerol acyltransferase